MDERMTICNMSIEGGARVGYVNPDETTFDYLRGPPVRAAGRRVRARRARGGGRWRPIRTRAYDDEVRDRRGARFGRPSRGASTPASRSASTRRCRPRARRRTARAVAEALAFMGFRGGAPIAGTQIDVAFVGSCTNARLSDLREAARMVRGRHVAPHVRALVVPGSQAVRARRRARGARRVFLEAGFEWRGAGCSMCLAMNPDRLDGPRGLRVVVEPQLQGTAGEPDRPHAADEPGDGRRRRGRRRTCVDVREVLPWPLSSIREIRGTGAAAARQRHRHRPHHPGALPEVDHVRGARAAPVRRRRAQADAAAGPSAVEPAYAGASCWW